MPRPTLPSITVLADQASAQFQIDDNAGQRCRMTMTHFHVGAHKNGGLGGPFVHRVDGQRLRTHRDLEKLRKTFGKLV